MPPRRSCRWISASPRRATAPSCERRPWSGSWRRRMPRWSATPDAQFFLDTLGAGRSDARAAALIDQLFDKAVCQPDPDAWLAAAASPTARRRTRRPGASCCWPTTARSSPGCGRCWRRQGRVLPRGRYPAGKIRPGSPGGPGPAGPPGRGGDMGRNLCRPSAGIHSAGPRREGLPTRC